MTLSRPNCCAMSVDPLLRVDGLEVVIRAGGADFTTVVDRVSLSVEEGERIGLVGESGSGKSLTVLAILGLIPETGELRAGRVLVDGVDAGGITDLRGGSIGLVMQDAASALNPVYSVGYQLVETIREHRAGGTDARRRAHELLAEVAIEDVESIFSSYPHQLSGGQAQRVMIALALAGEPRIVIADEPTTALDVITQARILDLLVRITDERGLGLILVSHDLAVVAQLVHRVVVLHQGRVVEEGSVHEVLRKPNHEATCRMVAAAARMHAGEAFA